jgi:hypothetical protein
MAPLVPDIISPEFNLMVALIVGVGFGYALEQAGFSSSRKLVGLFYGYDFTVLKVFFTAGVTAMTGVLLMGHLGMLNLDIIYINPMFVQSAIVGGLIMGAGFIMGGFCPGTSICAAAVGRIDAMMFIGGSMIGILLFTENFTLLEPLFNAGSMGRITIHEVLGISPELFGILLAIVAIIAFLVTNRIENHINKVKPILSKERRYTYAAIGALPVLLIMIIWITPSRQEFIWSMVEQKSASPEVQVESMDVDKLAFEVIHNAHKYNIIDVSDTTSYESVIPTSIHIPLKDLDAQAYRTFYVQPYKKNIFIADDPSDARKAAVLARHFGDGDPLILDASLSRFRQEIFSFPASLKEEDPDTWRFRNDARIILLQMQERLKNLSKPVIKQARIVDGGCT